VFRDAAAASTGTPYLIQSLLEKPLSHPSALQHFGQALCSVLIELRFVPAQV
jgi:hypothetical protein